MYNGATHRILELQSIRGIAALIVTLFHSVNYLKMSESSRDLASYILPGHAAVLIFFVLSGFVLSNYWSARLLKIDPLVSYFIRRAFRLYPAIWLSTAMGVTYFLARDANPMDLLFADKYVIEHIDGYDKVNFKTLISSSIGYSNVYSPQMWTIFVEIIGSTMIPLIIFVARYNITNLIIITLVLLVFGLLFGQETRFTLGQYLFCFPLGMIIEKISKSCSFSESLCSILSLVSLALLLSVRPVFGYGAEEVVGGIAVAIESIAAAGVLLGVVARKGGFRWLRTNSLVNLGEISYSLYAVHFAIILLLGLAGQYAVDAVGFIDPWTFGTIFVVLSTLLSVLTAGGAFHFIEKPGIRLGQIFDRKWRKP